jgi:FkbM family methyltransferase
MDMNATDKESFFSHIGQDMWVSSVFNGESQGYFLDFGAFDGVTISNTYFLEKHLHWGGICVEPNPSYYPQLCASRSVITVNAALWFDSRLSMSLVDAHGLSSFEQFAREDSQSERRMNARRRDVAVDTINPNELLERFQAPSKIHYLSLDVEGAEYDVISSIDLNMWRIALCTIEHNHNLQNQAKVRGFMAEYGYEVIQVKNEDWFWHDTICSEIRGTASESSKSPGDIALIVAAAYGVKE